MPAASAADYRTLAKARLPRFLFDYIDGGSYAEVTAARNVADLAAVELRQRVMVDVGAIDTATALFGRPAAMPVALAPVGLAGMYARRGEVQAARAAEAAGVPFTLSTMSVCPLAEVRAATRTPTWLQLYMIRDRAFLADLLARGRAAGCEVLVLTVDLPVAGARYRDRRSGLSGEAVWRLRARRLAQAVTRPRWAWDVGVRGRPHLLGNVAPVLAGKTGLEDFFAWIGANFDAAVTWRDLDWVRAHWPGTLVIKGVLDVADAQLAVEHGADGLVVSNHGGRQLDGVPSTARALPVIAEAVGERTTLLVDGGVRSGLDVARMLALGADGVLLGRAWAYALGAAGERGVAHLLRLIDAELRVAMALTGAPNIAAITRECLVPR